MLEKINGIDNWEARDDAFTLARAEEIKSDIRRYKNAKNMAKKLVKEKQENIRALKKIAGDNTVKNNQKSFFNTIDSSRG